eukprot:1187070-Prorocentrum_minimum.AAC.2
MSKTNKIIQFCLRIRTASSRRGRRPGNERGGADRGRPLDSSVTDPETDRPRSFSKRFGGGSRHVIAVAARPSNYSPSDVV